MKDSSDYYNSRQLLLQFATGFKFHGNAHVGGSSRCSMAVYGHKQKTFDHKLLTNVFLSTTKSSTKSAAVELRLVTERKKKLGRIYTSGVSFRKPK